MNTILLLVAMGLASAGLLYYALAPRKKDEQQAVVRRMSGKTSRDEVADTQQRARESVAAKMLARVAPIAVRPVMPRSSAEMSKLRIKLASAGFRTERSPMIFLASKTVVAIAAFLAVTTYFFSSGRPAIDAFGMGLFGAAVGFFAPNMWLSMAVKKRGEAIRNGLPDSLDLLVITVESGLALDGALQRVSDEMKHVHPILSEEFQIATREAQMGIPRGEALDNMAERTQVAEVKSLVAIVNQAEKFGTSIARALRHQADALRIKRRQAAEERAQKTAVKLMLPLICFIFPAIFVVLVGPAGIKMVKMAGSNPNLF